MVVSGKDATHFRKCKASNTSVHGMFLRALHLGLNSYPERLTLLDLYEICGRKSIYDYQDARFIQKNQYTKSYYLGLQDMEDGYSPARMLEILSDRVRYLIERGSTLNNPHIPAKYFNDWEVITENHAKRLRELVAQYFVDEK